MGEKHRYREQPDIITVCNRNVVTKVDNDCACEEPFRRRTKIHAATIPHGKRYFEADPCKTAHNCNPLIAKSATLQELRDFWRTQCCPSCNK